MSGREGILSPPEEVDVKSSSTRLLIETLIGDHSGDPHKKVQFPLEDRNELLARILETYNLDKRTTKLLQDALDTEPKRLSKDVVQCLKALRERRTKVEEKRDSVYWLSKAREFRQTIRQRERERVRELRVKAKRRSEKWS